MQSYGGSKALLRISAYWLLGWCMGITLVLSGGNASADAVGGPSARCPRGSYSESDHCGTWCRATTCQTEEDCKKYLMPHRDGGPACREVSLCVECSGLTSQPLW